MWSVFATSEGQGARLAAASPTDVWLLCLFVDKILLLVALARHLSEIINSTCLAWICTLPCLTQLATLCHLLADAAVLVPICWP